MKIEQISVSEYNVNMINSIADKYPLLRQSSKGVSFALTYGGTSYALVNQCGIPIEQAEFIESKYHELYKVSDDWVSEQIKQGSKVGHIEVAFGMRLRTPIIQQTIINKKSTPYESTQETRTAGNALGQSWGMLNNRTLIAFMAKVYKSKYAEFIKPICSIHDSNYFIIKNEVGIVEWVNEHLIAEMLWQEDPAIQHPDVSLGGALEVFYPDWSSSFKLPEKASKRAILALAKKHGLEIRTPDTTGS